MAGVFLDHGINMTSVQSKPPKRIKDDKPLITFQVDFRGSDMSPIVRKALRKIESMTVKDGLVKL